MERPKLERIKRDAEFALSQITNQLLEVSPDYQRRIENNIKLCDYIFHLEIELSIERGEIIKCEHCHEIGEPDSYKLDNDANLFCPKCFDELTKTKDSIFT